jgi:hypothetical protein
VGEVAGGQDVDAVDGGADAFKSAGAAVFGGGVGVPAGGCEGLGGGYTVGVGAVGDGDPVWAGGGGVGGRGFGGGGQRVDVALLVGDGAFEEADLPVTVADCWWARSRAVRRLTVSSSSTWRR